MAESDIAMKQYMGAKHRFADFFNVFTFGGRPIIKPEQLKPIDSESGIIAWCNKVIERNLAGMSETEIQSAKRTLWRHRDIIMEWNNGTYLSLLACETQDTPHSQIRTSCSLSASQTICSLSRRKPNVCYAAAWFSARARCGRCGTTLLKKKRRT